MGTNYRRRSGIKEWVRIIEDGLELLEIAYDFDKDMFDDVADGMEINGNWYEWDEIKHIVKVV